MDKWNGWATLEIRRETLAQIELQAENSSFKLESRMNNADKVFIFLMVCFWGTVFIVFLTR